MFRFNFTHVLLVAVITLSSAAVSAQSSSSEMRSLDEQVQQIKSEVLDIASELTLLEEQLLFPSNTQFAVFVELAEDDSMRLDAVRLLIDGEPMAHHIYSFKELEALQKGGIQRLFTGNLPRGKHVIEVSVIGMQSGGNEFTHTERFDFEKGIEPELLGVTLASPGIGAQSIQLASW